MQKKRYVLHVLDDEGFAIDKFKYTGVEVVRSTMPNGWGNLNPIDIKPARFNEALNQINADGIYVLNMMSSSLSNQLFELENAIDSGLVINRIELGSEFNHNNPFSEIKFPTAGDYAREVNTWVDSIRNIIPSTKIGVVAEIAGLIFQEHGSGMIVFVI